VERDMSRGTRTAVSGFVREIPRDVDKTRTIPFVIASATRDRHKTVVNMRNWQLENYRNNPIVGYQHDLYGNLFRPANPDSVIGHSRIKQDGQYLIGYVNPLAEKIFKKVKFGSIRAASSSFLEIGTGRYGIGSEAKGAGNETYYYHGQELIEWSIVKIGSNPEALIYDETGDTRSRKLKLLEKRAEKDLGIINVSGLSQTGALKKLMEAKRRAINECNYYILDNVNEQIGNVLKG
jgi:hypothetical protein